MGTNRIDFACVIFSLLLGTCNVPASAFAQYGSHPQNYYQQQPQVQHQRDLQLAQQQAYQQQISNQQQQAYQQQSYSQLSPQSAHQRTLGMPRNAHGAMQVQYTQQRLREEEGYSRPRYPVQQQYSSPFPRRLPTQRVGFRRRNQDDPFGENQSDTSSQSDTNSNQQDPFGEFQQPERNQTERVPQNGQDQGEGDFQIDPFADPPSNDNPIQQQPMQQREPIQQQPTQQRDPFGEGQVTDPRGTENPTQRATDPRNTDPRNTEQPAMPGRDPITSPPTQQPNGVDYPPGMVRPRETQPRQTEPRQTQPRQQMTPRSINEPLPYNPGPGSTPLQGFDSPPAAQMYPQVYPGSNQMTNQPSYPAYQPLLAPDAQVYQAPMTQHRMPGQQPTLAAPPTTGNDVYQGVVSNGCNDCGQSCGNSQCAADYSMPGGCPMFYFSIFGGSSSLGEMGNDQGDTLFTEDGGAFGVAIGQSHGRNLRSELEFSYRNNNLEQVALGSGQVRPLNGDLTSYSGMANVYWEFTEFPHGCLKPYIGAGLGFTSIDSSMTNLAGANLISNGGGNDSSFAYQFMAGVNYKAYRNMDLFLEYRLFKSDSLRLDTVPNWGSGDYDYEPEGIFAGLRWKF